MRKILLAFLIYGAALATSPSSKAQVAVTAAQEDLQAAYSLCTKRYVERDPKRKFDSKGEIVHKWQEGFENCEAVVAKHDATRDAQQNSWGDTTHHKSKINAIAGSK